MPKSLPAFVALVLVASTTQAADDPKAVEFFEAKIRPVLVDQCLKCHSDAADQDKKLRGGLKLDSKANWQMGGDTGPAIVPGKPGEGSLIASLKYAGDIQMPPKGKLPDHVVADFEKWIKDGAVDPRASTGTATAPAGIDIEKGRQFWSFQKPLAAPIPSFRDAKRSSFIRNPIDAFVMAKWDEQHLTPVGLADKRTLIRRATFDLTGLPPTPEEVAAFEKNTSPEAYAKMIDRLLASPRYGERWGRYWLDVARFAEDQAHTFGVKPKQNAFQYRDWVIRAFNNDMPYDQFARLQIAGDLVAESEGDPFTRLAGLGYMGLGAEYYKNTAREQAIAEELDDRVDTLTRGFLGLTVSCARCHDHKFDPLPTRDYYSIAGIFNGTRMTETPLAEPAEVKAFSEATAKVKAADDAVKSLLTAAGKKASDRALSLTDKYLAAAWELRAGRKTVVKLNSSDLAEARGLDAYFLDRWTSYINPANSDKAPPQFKEWFALKATASAEEVEKTAASTRKAVLDAVRSKNAAMMKAVLTDKKAPLFIEPGDVEKQFITAAEKPKLVDLRAELERCKSALPPAPPMAHVLMGNGASMKIYIRGNPATKGEDAPKGFLQVLAKPGAKPAENYTRLELANDIASAENPLTARVIVNRVWAWHFGRGLVNTPSNFGKLGDAPSHPELLDYLAVEFIKHGWSLKWLHRQIMGSSTYQLASKADADDIKSDAANVYLWRATRHRLDVEAWRDSLLYVSGNLDESIGGPTFDLKDSNAKRRTVYAKVSRHELDGLLRLFDFPDANVTADKRTSTTVPQQQLFALNSDFMLNQAKALATRVEKLGKTDEERITAAYQLCYQRPPAAGELKLALAFLKMPPRPEDKLTRWQQYCQVLLASNEFMYVD